MLRFLIIAVFAVAMAAHAQNGLTGQYYDTASFGTLKTTRTDATVNFDFGTAIPSGTAITNADTFSIVWAGQLEPEFTQLYTFYVTADDGARLWVNDQMVVTRTFAAVSPEMRGQVKLYAGQRVNIRLEYIEQTGSAKVKLEWSCASRAREVIPTARLFPTRVEKAGGSLLKEHWSGIAGGTIASLTSSANYPLKPSGREFITSFECLAQDWADSYGTRVTGYIVPPVSGNYIFAVSGDDVAELYLSTDATSANKSLIASVSAATGFRVWTAQPSQQSTARALVQGQRYYVELLHKENTGTDHWSVGWMKPGDAAFGVVPGSALVQPGLTTAQPAQANLLDTMAQEHPRIFATAERFAKLRATWLSATTSQPKTWAQNAINSATSIIPLAPVAYTQDVRGTILDQSRTVKDRMYKLGVAWQLTNDSAYAERAWTELNAVAAFPDWHPAHFLDTAEMTHAFAIGYDWFYNYWTQPRRDTIRTAIINFGLNAGNSQYTSNVGWSQSDGNNWNMVCNGGMIIGSLAVGTESEATTENIINRALNSTRPVWKHFTTDNGAWYEGPGYWGYTTEYGIRMFAALEWVLGSDFGISSTADVSEAGFAPIQALGTSNIIFNFADAGAGGAPRGPVFQWFARRYNQPLYDWWNNQGSGGALDALWWNDSTASLTSSGAQVDMAFHGDAGTAFQPQEMVTMRGKWSDSRATFVGVKGGQAGADHGDLDGGTFVLDALGKRWFHDLGSDNYALPGYFSSSPSTGTDRWDYYRMRPEGQNTLTINPSANADMVLNAVAPLAAYQSESGGSGSFSIHDLTPIYSGMTRVWRGTRLMGARDEVLVQDEIQAATGKTVWWFAHYTYPTTTVTIDPDGTSALMQQGAERLWCKIVSGGGTFQITDAVPFATSPNPAGQNANTGYKKLAINLTNVTNTTLAVWFVPLSSGDPIPTTLPTISALNTWSLATSNDAPVVINGVATSNGENAVDIDLRNYVTDDSTPADLMRFTVGGAVNGTVVLLADGHTARFTPNPGYTGVPTFTFTATDAGTDANTVLAWDFDLPDGSATNVATDASGNGRDGTIDLAGAGSYTLVADKPASLAQQGARSIDVVENVTTGARVQRVLAATELNWNTDNWTVAGWFKRRDTTNDDIVWHISDGDGFGSNDEVYLNCPAGATTVRLQHFNAVGAAFDVDIAQTGIAVGTWYHFAVVRNGTSLSLYINGTLVGTDSAFTFALNQASPLVFGGHASTTFAQQRWFDGGLDDLLVTHAVLDGTQIGNLAAGSTVRHFSGLSTTGTISLSAAAVNYVWTNPSTAASMPWTTGANWQSGAAPASTRGASVQFFTGQTLAGGTITSNNDIAGVFQMNNLTLAGTSTALTTPTITGGSFTLLNNAALLPTVTLSGTSGSATNKLAYNINTPVTLGADTTFNATNSGTFIFNGDISGPGGVTRNSTSSTLILSGTNTYTGDTIINAGTLQIGNDGATGTLGTGDVIDNGQLRFDRTGTQDVPNSISGTGSVYIDCPINGGTIVLSGTNTFDGGVTVNSGSLRITNSTGLGDGVKTITLTNGTNGAPHLLLDGSADPIELPTTISFLTSSNTGAVISEAGNNLISGNFSLNGGGGGTKVMVNAGTLTLDGSIAPITNGRDLLIGGTGTGYVTGTIANGNVSGFIYLLNSLTKSEAGTWTLSGVNSYSGNTTVSAGTLILGNSSALGNGGACFGTGKNSTSITSGATLDLNGQTEINEIITVNGTGVGAAGALINSSTAPASVASGVVSSLSVTTGGVHSTVPDVTITGTGSGATATAMLGLSAASFTISGGTTVYSVAPTVAITGGGGVGATANAVLTAGVVTGITITNAGYEYTTAPTIAFSGGTVTTAGTNPTGTGNATNFVVSALTVTNAGSGYTTPPTVSFSSGTGTVATANLSAVLLGGSSSIGGAGDITLNPPLTGNFALTKVGAGVLRLNGVNTFNGANTVSAGRLIVNGSIPGPGLTSVATGARLSGNGSSASNTTVTGILAPGDGFGTLTFTGTLTFPAAGRLEWELGSNATTGADKVVAGTVAVTAGAAVNVVLNSPGSTVDFTNSFWATTHTWSVLTATSKPNNFALGAAPSDINGRLATGYGAFSLQQTTTAVNLVWTPLPPIQQWRYTYFGINGDTGNAADIADTDGDGIPNLMEYATFTDPGTYNAVPATADKIGTNIEFTYLKNKAATDITYTVEWSDTLAALSWTAAGTGTAIPGTDNGVTVQMKAIIPAGAGVNQRFVHLKVTRP